MGLRRGYKAKVWQIRTREKFTSLQISTNKKVNRTDEYVKDFNGWVNCYGDAHDKCALLGEKASIEILDFEVKKFWDGTKEDWFVNLYDFNILGYGDNSTPSDSDGFMNIPAGLEEEMPFS